MIEAMDILMSECPPGFKADRMGEVAQNKEGKITIDTLAALRTRLNVLKDAYKMAKAKVEVTKLLAYTLEDLVKAVENPTFSKVPEGTVDEDGPMPIIHWSLTDQDSTPSEYMWHIRYKPILLKIAAFVCMALSILSFLGVICSMKGVDNKVSPYFLTVHSHNIDPVGLCVFLFISFGYTVYITIWAIFEIRMGSAYELVPGESTPEAVSFNVRMVARLAPPLAFFYLGWISENGLRSGTWSHNNAYHGLIYYNQTVPVQFNITNTTTGLNQTITVWETQLNYINSTAIAMPSVFSHFYQLQAISTFQNVFGTICPCVLYIVLALFLLNIFNRLLVCAKLDRYQFGAGELFLSCFLSVFFRDDRLSVFFLIEIVTEDQLREGKKQLERERAVTVSFSLSHSGVFMFLMFTSLPSIDRTIQERATQEHDYSADG
jgi:hypothetical protein